LTIAEEAMVIAPPLRRHARCRLCLLARVGVVTARM
jgi:hypothetical protein